MSSPAPSPPPPVPIKLFVGQVSRTVAEDTLHQIFAPYGTISELVVIRDRISKAHRGCAFVTFETQQQADAATAALHGVYRFEGMQNSMQITAANGSSAQVTRRSFVLNKLYVGGFSPACDVQHLTLVFSRFGKVLDVSILKRRRNSDNMCCAFVRFHSREEARAGVEGMSGSTELDFENGTTPLVVKYAENKEMGGGGAMQRSTIGPQPAAWGRTTLTS